MSGSNQRVILPNLTAGCSMADMAQIDDVLDCWDDLTDVLGDRGGVVPITYMNSTADIKRCADATTELFARPRTLQLRSSGRLSEEAVSCSFLTSTSAGIPASRWVSISKT